MADLNSLLAQYAGEQNHLNKIANIVATKQQQVSNTAAIKQEQLSPTQVRKSAVASVFDVPVTGTQIEQDVDTMSGADLYMKYGDTIIDPLVQRERQRTQIQGTLAAEDSVPQVVGNSVLSLGQGLANTVGGVGALGLGVLNDNAGIAASQLLQQYNENANSLKSDNLRESMRLNQEVNAITEQTSAAQYAKDVAEKGALVAGLSRIGREALDSGSALLSDPRMLGDVTAQGVGSLLAVGPLGKAIAAGGNTGLAGKSISNFLAKNSTAGAIGLVGGGGTYTSTVNDWMGKSHQELMAESPEYVSLLATNTPEEAKRIIADNAGKVAAAIAGPTSMVLGKLVDKFEVDPTKALGFKGTLSALGRETIEEGLEGSANQIASNIAGNVIGGTNTSLTEGVGRQLGEGAVAGLFTTGAVRAPSVLAGGIVETAKLGGGIVNAGTGFLARRAKQKQEEEAAVPPPVADSISAVNTSAEAAINELNTTASTLPQEEQQPIKDVIDQIKAATNFDDNDLALYGETVQNLVKDKDSYTAINALANLATDETQSDEIRDEASFAVLDMYNKVSSFIGSNEEMLNDPNTSDEVGIHINKIVESLNNLFNNTDIATKLASISKDYTIATGNMSPFTAEQIGQPEQDNDARKVIIAAQTNPGEVNPELLNTVLQHASARKWQLSATTLKALKASYNLAVQLGTATKDTKDLEGIERVTNEIIKNTKIAGIKGKSADQHIRDVRTAFVNKDRTALSEAMESFGAFVQHLQNKSAALEESKNTTNFPDVSFAQLVRNNDKLEFVPSTIHYLSTEGGIKFYNRTKQEAQLVGNLYNSMVYAYKAGKPVALTTPVEPTKTKAEPKQKKSKLTPVEKTEVEKQIAELDKEISEIEKLIKSLNKEISKFSKQGNLYTALKNTLSAKHVKALFGDNKSRNFYAKKASEVNPALDKKELVEVISDMLALGSLRNYVIENADDISDFIDVEWDTHAETIINRFQEDSPYKYLQQSAINGIQQTNATKSLAEEKLEALTLKRIEYETTKAAEELAQKGSERPRSDDQSSTGTVPPSQDGSAPKPATDPSGQPPEPTGTATAEPTRVEASSSSFDALQTFATLNKGKKIKIKYQNKDFEFYITISDKLKKVSETVINGKVINAIYELMGITSKGKEVTFGLYDIPNESLNILKGVEDLKKYYSNGTKPTGVKKDVVGYHYTESGTIDPKLKTNKKEKGLFFFDSYENASKLQNALTQGNLANNPKGKIVKATFKLENALKIDAQNKDTGSVIDLVAQAYADGYDGAIITNLEEMFVGDSTQYVIFNTENKNNNFNVEPTTKTVTPVVDENSTEGYYDDSTMIEYEGSNVIIIDKLEALNKAIAELTKLTNCTL